VVALLGANGAGKTTLLRVASGLLHPSSGRLTLGGEDITRKSPHELVARGVCHVPEGRGIFPSLTVRDNLILQSPKGAEKTAIERAVSAFPRLGERLSQLAGTLSGGEQQMLAIGRALMSRPKLLLLDEPSLGLAPIMVDTIFQVIRDINQRGTTILLIEQNAAMALGVANRGYVLETGRIVKEGSAKALLESPDVQRAYLGI
jgi:branched-chain amino acid transport system ATP-binding protein